QRSPQPRSFCDRLPVDRFGGCSRDRFAVGPFAATVDACLSEGRTPMTPAATFFSALEHELQLRRLPRRSAAGGARETCTLTRVLSTYRGDEHAQFLSHRGRRP